MKEKLNKLLESWGIGNNIQGRHEQARFRDDIADEILELFSPKVDWVGIDPAKWGALGEEASSFSPRGFVAFWKMLHGDDLIITGEDWDDLLERRLKGYGE